MSKVLSRSLPFMVASIDDYRVSFASYVTLTTNYFSLNILVN